MNGKPAPWGIIQDAILAVEKAEEKLKAIVKNEQASCPYAIIVERPFCADSYNGQSPVRICPYCGY